MKTFNSNDIENLNIEETFKYFDEFCSELYFLSRNIDDKINGAFEKYSRDEQLLFLISKLMYNTSNSLDSILLLHQ